MLSPLQPLLTHSLLITLLPFDLAVDNLKPRVTLASPRLAAPRLQVAGALSALFLVFELALCHSLF